MSPGLARRSRSIATAAALGALCGIAAGTAAAAERAPDNPAARWWAEIRRRLAAATAPAPEPPVPVKVVWTSRRMASVDLGAPILALEAADLDGDGIAELVALTTREVLALRRAGRRKVEIVARAPLPEAPAGQRSRDSVGTLAVADVDADGAPEVLARSSDQAAGVAFALRDGALAPLRELDAFPLCGFATARLRAGRNYFEAASFHWSAAADPPMLPERFYDARCADLVDPAGARYGQFGVVDTDGTLAVQRLVSCGAEPCRDQPIARVELRNRGVAFEIADIDNDGYAEVMATTNRAPGRGDQVTIYTGDGGELRRVARSKKFTGGVAGLAAGDIDGDGDRDVVAAVRLLGSTKVDLWTLNR